MLSDNRVTVGEETGLLVTVEPVSRATTPTGGDALHTHYGDSLTPTEQLTDSGTWVLDCRTGDLRWTAGTRRIHAVDPE